MKSLRLSEAEIGFLCGRVQIETRENSFSRFTGKRKILELNIVISANINLPIAVILSPHLSLYDLQKPRYDFRQGTATCHKKGVAHRQNLQYGQKLTKFF